MDENVVEEIKMHQETIATDSNSPLHLIREKELEISGRMLTAKRSADTVIADARKQAAEVVAKAEAEGGSGAQDHARKIEARSKEESAALQGSAEVDAEAIRKQIDSRREDAVKLVIEVVTSV